MGEFLREWKIRWCEEKKEEEGFVEKKKRSYEECEEMREMKRMEKKKKQLVTIRKIKRRELT